MNTKITYFVSECKAPGFSYEVTVQREGKERQSECRWKNSNEMFEAIGFATAKAVQSKQDYGNKNVKLVIELNVCSIIDPIISI